MEIHEQTQYGLQVIPCNIGPHNGKWKIYSILNDAMDFALESECNDQGTLF